MKVKVLVAQLFLTLCNPMDCSSQAPLSVEFPRQEYCSGLPIPSSGNFYFICKDNCISNLSVLTYIPRDTRKKSRQMKICQMGYHMLFLVAHNVELPRRKSKLINNTKGENNVTVIFLLLWFVPSLFGRDSV